MDDIRSVHIVLSSVPGYSFEALARAFIWNLLVEANRGAYRVVICKLVGFSVCAERGSRLKPMTFSAMHGVTFSPLFAMGASFHRELS